ncbi:MAG: diguanylate cyclase [Bacillota bacterium]
MTHRDDGRRALLPIPVRTMRGFLPYLAISLFGLAGITLLVVLRPPLWSHSWWASLLIGLLGTFLALVDWRRLSSGGTFPLTLLINILALGLLWHEPGGLAGPMLLVLTSTFIGAFFPTVAVVAHLGLVALFLAASVWLGGDAGTATFLAVIILGVTAFMRVLYQALREQAVQTDHLQRLMELLPVLKAHGVEEVIQAAVRHMVKATVSHLGVVLVLDDATKTLRAHYIYCETSLSGDEARALMNVDVPLGVGLSGWVAQHGQALVTGDAARDPRALQVPGTSVVDESIMVVPLMTNGRLYGVLRLDRPGLNQYREEDLSLLELMAAHVSDALSRAQMEERMARRDALTGVYNRHYLNEWSERLEPDRAEISLLMIDCRGFKQINDRWGHLEGDRVLQECARIISESVRSRDLVVRYGGDEFLVVLENTGANEAAAIAERLKGKVREWNAVQLPDSPRLSLDIGIETAQRSQWQLLLGRADVRMYASKRGA